MPIAYITRRIQFSAAHRLHSNKLTEDENLEIFGKCNHPHGHGHNYVLEVTVRNEINPKTGMVMNLSEIKKILEETIMTKVDHKNLNVDVREFQTLNPTAENFAVVIWSWLIEKIPDLFQVKLHETENNFVIYRGNAAEKNL